MKKQLIPILFGGIVMLGFVLFLVFHFLVGTSTTPGPTSTGSTSTGGHAGDAAPQATPVLKDPTYTSIVQNEVSQVLHLQPAQVLSQLQAGKTMTAIASSQGISDTQLRAAEQQSFKDLFIKAVKDGKIQQQSADNFMQQLQQDPLYLDSKTAAAFGFATGGR